MTIPDAVIFSLGRDRAPAEFAWLLNQLAAEPALLRVDAHETNPASVTLTISVAGKRVAEIADVPRAEWAAFAAQEVKNARASN